MEQRVYSRKYLRIQPDKPLFGTVRIIRVNNRHTVSNPAKVRIHDLCLGGARFVSVLQFPADNKVILELALTLEGQEYRLEGFVKHSRSNGPYGYEYGYCFREPDARLRRILLQIFSRQMARQGRLIILFKPNMGMWN